MQNSPLNLQSLCVRVEKLERQNRLLKRAILAIFLLPAAIVVMGQAHPARTIEAEQFILRDAQGRQKLTIGTPRVSGVAVDLTPDEPALWIAGNNGVDRAILTSGGLRFSDDKGRALGSYLANRNQSAAHASASDTIEGRSFVLREPNGVKRAELAVVNANPIFRFFDSNEKVKAVLSANGYTIFGTGMRTFGKGKESIQAPNHSMSLGPYGLDFSDEHGKAVITLGGVGNPTAPSILPSLQLFDSDEKSRLELSGRSDFGPSIYLNDDAGKARVSLGLTSLGPYVIVNDSEGFTAELGSTSLVTPRTGEQHKSSAASLVLFGKDGKVLWSAP